MGRIFGVPAIPREQKETRRRRCGCYKTRASVSHTRKQLYRQKERTHGVSQGRYKRENFRNRFQESKSHPRAGFTLSEVEFTREIVRLSGARTAKTRRKRERTRCRIAISDSSPIGPPPRYSIFYQCESCRLTCFVDSRKARIVFSTTIRRVHFNHRQLKAPTAAFARAQSRSRSEKLGWDRLPIKSELAFQGARNAALRARTCPRPGNT